MFRYLFQNGESAFFHVCALLLCIVMRRAQCEVMRSMKNVSGGGDLGCETRSTNKQPRGGGARHLCTRSSYSLPKGEAT